jgi:hypothetical protein
MTSESQKRKDLVCPDINHSQDLERLFVYLLDYANDLDEGHKLNDARRIFFGNDDDLLGEFFEMGYEPYFLEWFFADYRTDEDKSLVDLFIESFSLDFGEEEIGLLEIIRDSIISVYRLEKTSDSIIAQDLLRGDRLTIRDTGIGNTFTTDDYWVCRFVPCAGSMELLGNPITINSGDIDLILDRYRESFSDFISQEPNAEWEHFLKLFGRMLYEYTFHLIAQGICEPDEDAAISPLKVDRKELDIDPIRYREIITNYLLSWCDRPNEALAGKTPREVSANKIDRHLVAKLLDQMETLQTEGEYKEMYNIIKKELNITE